MTADTKLLPLPELPVAVERFILSSLGPVKREGAVTALRTMLREYARANVAHATAPLQAEIEAARKDSERLDWLAIECIPEGLIPAMPDIHGYAFEVAEENGRNGPNRADHLAGYRRMIDAARANDG